MRALVLYASLTGNTRKVAQAIAEELGVPAVDVRKERIPDFANVGLLLVGDGVYVGLPSRAMVRALKSLPPLSGVKAAVFGTYGSWPRQLAVLERILAKKGAQVVGRFACPGRDLVSFGLLRHGRPNEDDLAAARDFARKVAEGKA